MDSYIEVVPSEPTEDPWATLAELLMQPQKKDAQWGSRAGRLVSMAYAKTLSVETDNLDYLRLLSLCKWAQSVGIPDAKKKNVQAVRFRQQRPPPLALLSTDREVNAALVLLADLRADWCAPYIAEIVSCDLLGKAEIPRVCDWACNISSGIDDLLRLVLKARLEAPVDAKLSEVWIKALTDKFTLGPRSLTSADAAADVLSAALATDTILRARQVPKGLLALIWKLLARIIDVVRAAHPLVLIEPSFLSALKSLASSPLASSHKKEMTSYLSRLIPPTLSCVGGVIERGGREGEDFVKSALPLLSAAFPEFSKRLADSASRSSVLAVLSESDSDLGVVSLEDHAASVYARLLPAWLDFCGNYPEPEKISVMTANLLEAASLNRIEFLGAVGDVVLFDPITYRIDGADTGPARPVRVVRPPLVFKRDNGSYRVVLPGIVTTP
jgi:hypothetical protein